MIGLQLTFDLGRYHATPWGSNVNDGTVEWPPSPWRLLRGLYAVGRTHTDMAGLQADLDRALASLASASPPVFDLPITRAAHTRHYMPVPKGKEDKRLEVIDGFVALDPAAALVAWWDATLDADAHDALAAAARRLGYLGRSESVCTAELVTGAGPADPVAVPLEIHDADAIGDEETIDLLCLATKDPIEAMAIGVTELRARRMLTPPGTRRVTYLVRRDTESPARDLVGAPSVAPKPDLALLRITGGDRPALFEAVKIGHLLRSALQSRFGETAKGGVSPTFSGRSGDRRRTDQHRHAHYLSLPDRNSRRIDRMVVWAPEGLGPDEVAALAATRKLFDRDPRDGSTVKFDVALTTIGNRTNLRLPDLIGPAREWESLTPFALVRHPKRRRGEIVDAPGEQVVRELDHRDFPTPEAVELEPGSAHRFRSSKLGESRLDRRPLVGVKLRFAEEVTGPISIGALNHYGLGLMVSRG